MFTGYLKHMWTIQLAKCCIFKIGEHIQKFQTKSIKKYMLNFVIHHCYHLMILYSRYGISATAGNLLE
jgi:hypothetical protein